MNILYKCIVSLYLLLYIGEARSTRFIAFFDKGVDTPDSKVAGVRESLKGKIGCRIIYEYELTLKGFAFDLDHDDSTLFVLESLRKEFQDEQWPITIEVDSEVQGY